MRSLAKCVVVMLVVLPGMDSGPAAAAAPRSWPWGVEATVGSGWPDPALIRFADLNGDGRDELVNIQPNGVARAWTNNGRFPGWPWGRMAPGLQTCTPWRVPVPIKSQHGHPAPSSPIGQEPW